MDVLVVSVHPDDETLGCGGTLLKHRAAGDTLHWVVITEARPPQWSAEVIARKTEEVRAVADAYGMRSVNKLGFPTVRLDQVPQDELIAKIRSAIEAVRPSIVYLVHRGDVHSDHRAAFDAVMSVCKPFYLQRLGISRILSFETLSSTDAAAAGPADAFTPTVFIDVTEHLERKIEIMALYETEQQPDPMPRGASAIRALARTRGAAIGVQYAESFVLVRERG